jgi:hypothetical protein
VKKDTIITLELRVYKERKQPAASNADPHVAAVGHQGGRREWILESTTSIYINSYFPKPQQQQKGSLLGSFLRYVFLFTQNYY